MDSIVHLNADIRVWNLAAHTHTHTLNPPLLFELYDRFFFHSIRFYFILFLLPDCVQYNGHITLPHCCVVSRPSSPSVKRSSELCVGRISPGSFFPFQFFFRSLLGLHPVGWWSTGVIAIKRRRGGTRISLTTLTPFSFFFSSVVAGHQSEVEERPGVQEVIVQVRRESPAPVCLPLLNIVVLLGLKINRPDSVIAIWKKERKKERKST